MTIAIVVISFNSGRFLKQNLKSLLTQSVPFSQIVVVDNHSHDDSLEILQAHGKQIKVLSLHDNSGYAAAANLGIDAVDSDIVVIANPDTIFAEDFNARVTAKMKNEPHIDLLSPLLLRFDKRTVDSAGQACSKALYPMEIGFNRDKKNVPIAEGPIFSVCGAATVFRRSALQRLKMGGHYYDEDFFIFWEDFDIGWRAHLLGLKTWFLPDAVVYHFRSGTLEKNWLARFSLALARPPLIKYHLVKNRFLCLIKNFRFRRNYKNLPYVFLKDMIWVPLLTFSSPKIIIPLMKSGKYFKAALKKREQISGRMTGNRSVTPEDDQSQ